MRSSRLKISLLALTCLGMPLVATPAFSAPSHAKTHAKHHVAAPAQAAPAPTLTTHLAALDGTITTIRVEGNERLEPDAITAHLTIAKGDAATPDAINDSLKALYATGLFADLHLDVQGDTLVVRVEENPVVNRVVFEGNDAISKDDLEKEVQIKPRLVYTLPRVQRDVQRILDVYRRSGRFAALVEPKLVKLEQNRVDVIFEITEGSRTGIRNISFIGNGHFSQDELTHAISTRESAWWRIFSSSDYYDPDRMNYDKELLRKFYLNEGYADFRVASAVAELTPDHDDFFMTFTLDEGSRYKFGTVKLGTEIKGLNADDLRRFLSFKEGDWYSAEQIEKSITKLTTVLGDKQYAFASVTPTMERHKDSLSVDITLDIKQGERVYVGRIDVGGNSRTVDKVIRREIPLAEGDPYNASKIHKAEQKIKDLGFFDEVKVTPTEGAQPDRANIKVDVKEKSTGEVAIGAGFSSTDGPLGDFSISERNFMGKGQNARLGASVSGRTRQVDLSFTEPHVNDRNLSLGGDIFARRTNNQDVSSYDTGSAGFAFRGGYPLSDVLRQNISYSLHRDTINNVPSTASPYIQVEAGNSVTSSLSQTLTYDRRDSKLEPTEGFVTHVDADLAGLGGTRHYVRGRLGGTQYIPIADKWILSGTAELGQVWMISGVSKINERFFLGGDSLRGFQYAGFGPRDLSSTYSDALGGTRFTRASLELNTPTPFPDELGLVGHIFTDAGTLGKVDQSIPDTPISSTDESVHASLGIGVTWSSPFGPVRLDFAEPILYKSYDKLEHIHFSFGTKF